MTTTTAAEQSAPGRAEATVPDALASTWRAIRRHRRDVPAVTLSVTPGRGSACGAVVWDADAPVILLGAQTLAAGPRAILETLLHQAAHGVLRARGGRLATSTGRYHSSGYRDMAASLGLQAGSSPHDGWSQTVLRDDTAGAYATQLTELAAAIENWEPPASPPGSTAWSTARNGITATCQCTPQRTIRMRGRGAADDLRERPIRCEACGQLFAEAS